MQERCFWSQLLVLTWFLQLDALFNTNHSMECTQCLLCTTTIGAFYMLLPWVPLHVSAVTVSFMYHQQGCHLHVTAVGTFLCITSMGALFLHVTSTLKKGIHLGNLLIREYLEECVNTRISDGE